MIDNHNCLNMPYDKYVAQKLVWRLCKEIPQERRQAVREKILSELNLNGRKPQNGDALKAALKHLKEEPNGTPNGRENHRTT